MLSDDLNVIDSMWVGYMVTELDFNALQRIKNALVEAQVTSTNTGSPKFCFNCKPESVLWRKMVDSFYDYCPYCGAKLRAGA